MTYDVATISLCNACYCMTHTIRSGERWICGKCKTDKFRIAEWDDEFLAERYKSPGVWDIVATVNSRKEAENVIEGL